MQQKALPARCPVCNAPTIYTFGTYVCIQGCSAGRQHRMDATANLQKMRKRLGQQRYFARKRATSRR